MSAMMDNAQPTLLASGRAKTDVPADINAGDFPDRLFDHYLDRLSPREGKAWNDPNPRAGLTYKGITQETVNRLRGLRGGRWSALPQLPTQLSDQNIREIYREKYFDEGRSPVVAVMPGVIERTPELPEQLFDSGVQHSPTRAGQFLQQALEEIIGSKDLRDSRTGNYTGNVGPNTQAALRDAIAKGKLDEVNDRMAEIRLEAIKNGYAYKNHPEQREGLENRALSFMTSRRPKPPSGR
ncbi:MAG TPA: glycosyl hydrolase 108 family protein [Alphaproteobacteria bacterium]|nr:glycosyl hydrolase 108 family protein [Alphaproteobacteria bacterium]